MSYTFRMRLIPCRSCNNHNSPKARTCPRCGHPSYEPKNIFLTMFIILACTFIFVLAMVYAILYWIIPGALSA